MPTITITYKATGYQDFIDLDKLVDAASDSEHRAATRPVIFSHSVKVKKYGQYKVKAKIRKIGAAIVLDYTDRSLNASRDGIEKVIPGYLVIDLNEKKALWMGAREYENEGSGIVEPTVKIK